MDRKLASIQKIESITSIEGADSIDKARVMGWDVVVKRGDFVDGDKAIFCEVDSVLSDGPEWSEFMRSRKFRIRTIRLRGVLSQGLVLPLSILPSQEGLEIGQDVTELLGIKKYEIPEHSGGAKMGCAKGNFPHFVPKTDETRVQSALGVLDELKGKPYYITVKCDGTSSTFVYWEDELIVCSRNFMKKEDETNIYWQMVKKYNLKEKLSAHPGFAVQAEIVGPGIQKNRMGLKETEFRVFNVYNVNEKRYLNHMEMIDFCDIIELPRVPLLVLGDNFKYTLEELLDLAKGKYEGTDNDREGIVVRPMVEAYSPTLKGRLSFKVLNNDYLLKNE